MTQSSELIQSAQRTLRLELEAVEALLARIDGDFVKACELILASKGRVVVVGMGKSGHIGNKIAATFASTGTPAQFRFDIFVSATASQPIPLSDNDKILAADDSRYTAALARALQ